MGPLRALAHPVPGLYIKGRTLMLLVQKNDRFCGFCVDYLGLNQTIVEDKFPILVINETFYLKNIGTFFFSNLSQAIIKSVCIKRALQG